MFIICKLGLFSLLLSLSASVDWNIETDLDRYVFSNEEVTKYEVLDVQYFPQFQLHILNLTSLKWMDETWSSRPTWWHYLSIFIPNQIKIQDSVYYVIGGGAWNDEAPNMDSSTMNRTANFSISLGIVSAYIKMIPFQPIHFPGEVIPHSEDLIIGHTWKLYIQRNDSKAEMFALSPMTKAARIGIDTAINYTQEQIPSLHLKQYFVTGYSKRGWTSWLLGCVDRRVFAMAPTVYDLLDMQPNLEHHYRAYGGWSWAFLPYYYEGVPQYLYDPKIQEMLLFMDPLSYKERLVMPKLVIGAMDDEFFLPDDGRYFIDEILEPKFLQMWENDTHSLTGHNDQRLENLKSFFLTSYNKYRFPIISWIRSENATDGKITFTTDTPPLSIGCWWADTTNVTCEDINSTLICRRDFRIQTASGESGIVWRRCEVQEKSAYEYVAEMPKRKDNGFRGFFIEATYHGVEYYTTRYTTDLHIIPDEFPYPKCQTPEECQGRIV